MAGFGNDCIAKETRSEVLTGKGNAELSIDKQRNCKARKSYATELHGLGLNGTAKEKLRDAMVKERGGS